jgi:hypothetical protein
MVGTVVVCVEPASSRKNVASKGKETAAVIEKNVADGVRTAIVCAAPANLKKSVARKAEGIAVGTATSAAGDTR